MKNLQKLIAIIAIFTLLLSPIFNFISFKSKEVKALDGGGSWANAIKETVLDAVGWSITDRIIKWMEVKITNWGMGRNTDANIPFPVPDFGEFFRTALDIGSAKFIAKYQLTPICSPIKISLGELPEIGWYASERDYQYFAACSLQDVVGNVEQFFAYPDIGFYGENARAVWLDLMNPQNNIYGAWLMATEEREKMEEAEKEAADKETAVSSGVQNETASVKTDTEACQENCQTLTDACIADCGLVNPVCITQCNLSFQSCTTGCEVQTRGITVQEKVKNLGTTINKYLESSMSADMQRVISADEITELLGVFFNALLNKAINGLGSFFSTTQATERNRAEVKDTFGYRREFQRSLTSEKIKDTRAEVLSIILKSVQNFDRSITACDNEDEMMNNLEYSRNISDMFNANLESLYTGLTGANLKPDFEIMDPVFAPFTLYGYSWSQIPLEKFPSKCQKTLEGTGATNGTCMDIYSSLEPNYNRNCGQCMYDHSILNCPPAPYPPQPYPSGGNDPFANQNLITQKQTFYNGCRGWYNIALNRCEQCIKNVDEKCQELDPAEKEQCIMHNCSNYGDLATHITRPLPYPVTDAGALDFYNRCLIEEKKDACYTCLREYFVPASYCDEVNDYFARAIIKYPAVVLLESRDDGASVGRYDEILGAMGGECNNDSGVHAPIQLDLICRIIPDFQSRGSSICQTQCLRGDMTQAQLDDITDFRPNGIDCNRQTLNIGGRVNVWQAIKDGQLNTLSKCCATLWQHDENIYGQCLGTGRSRPRCTGGAIPPQQEPWCYCPTGWRPLDFNRTGGAPGDGNDFPPGAGRGGDCAGFSFSSTNPLLVYTGNGTDGNAGWDRYYISSDGNCSEADPRNNTDLNDDNVPDGTSTDATAPGGILWSATPDSAQRWCIPTSVSGTGLSAGVYHNGNNDIGSAIHLCTLCNPADPNYQDGTYGFTDRDGNPANQCTGKNPGSYHYSTCP